MRLPWRKLVLILAALGVVGLVVYGFLPQPVEVDVGKVTRGRLVVTVDHEGKTRVKDRYVVAAPLAGDMQRVALRAGDKVGAGYTPLTAITPGPAALLNERELAHAKGKVEVAAANRKAAAVRLELAQTTLKLARDELARVRTLIQRKSASQHDLDTAMHKERAAELEIHAARWGEQIARWEEDVARAALVRAQPDAPDDVRDRPLVLKSPINGVVLRVFQESATPVTPGQKVLELGDLTELECEIDLLSADAVKVTPGARVFLEHWGGERPLPGRVRLVEPSGFTKLSALGVEEQRVNVLVDFLDPPGKRPPLGDAYRVEARIVVWEADDVLKVPAGALFRHEGKWAVFVAADGRAELRHVRAGRSNGLETEVVEGLNENDAVILHPGDRIRPGGAVRARDEK